jgi:hypothetical protein
MVIKTEKGYIAIPSKKRKNSTLSIVKIAEILAKKIHKTDSFYILSP